MSLAGQMPEESRVWIYQAEREFTNEELNKLEERLIEFIERWTSHSKSVKAGYEVRYNRFLIILLDESHVSAGGCSIDSSVHFIQSLETDFQNSLTDRMKFALKIGNEVEVVSKNEFEKLVDEGLVSDDSIVFNNLVNTKGDLTSKWEIPFSKSWHKQYFGIKT